MKSLQNVLRLSLHLEQTKKVSYLSCGRLMKMITSLGLNPHSSLQAKHCLITSMLYTGLNWLLRNRTFTSINLYSLKNIFGTQPHFQDKLSRLRDIFSVDGV